jgi:Lar family restriction alleviation protein
MAPARLASATIHRIHSPPLPSSTTMKPEPQMSELPAEKQAAKAIAHTLRNISERPGVAWYLGHGTQTYALLTEAHATLHGITMREAQENWPPADQPDYSDCHNNCPFCGSSSVSDECDSSADKHYMKCLDCGASGPRVVEYHYDSREQAVEAATSKWNERTMPR